MSDATGRRRGAQGLVDPPTSYDATGARIRRLPLTPARVKAAIAQL